jgi:hypothetical protein
VNLLGNIVGYQLVWFVIVYGAGAGRLWPGLLAAALFALWQLTVSQERAADLRLIGIALALGMLIDGALARSGLLSYASAAPALPPAGAPVWILALWISFALTLNHSLRWLRGRLALGALAGALGGPLAYLGAARLSGAVSFATPAWQPLAGLALGWALALALLAACARVRPQALRA